MIWSLQQDNPTRSCWKRPVHLVSFNKITTLLFEHCLKRPGFGFQNNKGISKSTLWVANGTKIKILYIVRKNRIVNLSRVKKKRVIVRFYFWIVRNTPSSNDDWCQRCLHHYGQLAMWKWNVTVKTPKSVDISRKLRVGWNDEKNRGKIMRGQSSFYGLASNSREVCFVKLNPRLGHTLIMAHGNR